MTALPNTRDALETSLQSAGRHAHRIAHHSRNAAQDIGAEMREFLSELESTLADGTQADSAALREQLRRRIGAARARLDGARGTMRARAADAVAGADEYVHENPWETVAIVGGLALVTGWFLAVAARNR